MIGFLRGLILEVTTESALVDVNGVGYEILASSPTLTDLEGAIGKEVMLWIHTHVREDAMQLFAFSSKDEKNLFLSLLKVTGVGPKSALSILSGGRPQDILAMIETGNAKALSALPKVGKKTAEQIILSLKGKLVLLSKAQPRMADGVSQISSALTNLGYKSHLVDEFVATLPSDISIEEGVRKGLQTLSGAMN